MFILIRVVLWDTKWLFFKYFIWFHTINISNPFVFINPTIRSMTIDQPDSRPQVRGGDSQRYTNSRMYNTKARVRSIYR
ncbi:hypothetical protein L1987_67981 [Smallanthus sonchifolius]|uniref:Uncharacterized protein n=1 Tax=Smallanthus sonchifolius TaxID=185202 RepID=A0ACB9B4D8_9ASTR|nr:hypothetical protein L1987_67981 [Smallanthus sonchifolius]